VVRNGKEASGKWGTEERGGGWPFKAFGEGECNSREGTKTSCDEVIITRELEDFDGFSVTIDGVRRPEFDFVDRFGASVTKIYNGQQFRCRAPSPTPSPTKIPTPSPTEPPTHPGPHVVVSGAWSCLKTTMHCPQYESCSEADQVTHPTKFSGMKHSLLGVTCCKLSSSNARPSGTRPGCKGKVNWLDAAQHCADNGMRLCSAVEIKKGAGEATGCEFDHSLVWTSDTCTDSSPPPPSPAPLPPPHICSTDKHGCDKGDGGECFESSEDPAGFKCGCKADYKCVSGCDTNVMLMQMLAKEYIATHNERSMEKKLPDWETAFVGMTVEHKCVKTAAPTPFPTAHPTNGGAFCKDLTLSADEFCSNVAGLPANKIDRTLPCKGLKCTARDCCVVAEEEEGQSTSKPTPPPTRPGTTGLPTFPPRQCKNDDSALNFQTNGLVPNCAVALALKGCNDPFYGAGLKKNCPVGCKTCPGEGVSPTPNQLVCLKGVACEVACIEQSKNPGVTQTDEDSDDFLLQAPTQDAKWSMPQVDVDVTKCNCPAVMKKIKGEEWHTYSGPTGEDRTKARVLGTTINTDAAQGWNGKGQEEGVRCKWINTQTGIHTEAVSDAKGRYKMQLDRCGLYHVECYKKGMIPPGFGGSACQTPYMLAPQHIQYTTAIMPYLEKGKVSATLTWVDDNMYVKDLDLHLLVPGKRDVFLKDYKKQHFKNKIAAAQFRSALKSANGNRNATFTFKGSDLSKHIDIHDPVNHIYYDNKGSRHAEPYAKFELDHGSIDGSPTTGGPEVISIVQDLVKTSEKQYALWVDCWSCDEYEDLTGYGADVQRYNPATGLCGDEECDGDQKTQPPFVKESLVAFQNSGAHVKLFSGNHQMYCSSIGNAARHPTTRWDAILIQPHKHEAETYAGTSFNKHISVLDKEGNVLLDHINEFKQGYPTVDVQFEQELAPTHGDDVSKGVFMPAPVDVTDKQLAWKKLQANLPYKGDLAKAISAQDSDAIKYIKAAKIAEAEMANLPYSGNIDAAYNAGDHEAMKIIRDMMLKYEAMTGIYNAPTTRK